MSVFNIENIQYLCGDCGVSISRNRIFNHAPCFPDGCYLELDKSYIYHVNEGDVQILASKGAVVFQNTFENSKAFEIAFNNIYSGNSVPEEQIHNYQDNAPLNSNSISNSSNSSSSVLSKQVESDTFSSDSEGMWSSNKVKLLLSIYTEVNKLYDNGAILTKKMLNKKICEKMKRMGYNFEAAQIENKLRSLKNMYKKRIDNKGPKKSGRGRLNIPFETDLQNAFGNDHAVDPPATIDATNIYTSTSGYESSLQEEESLESFTLVPESPPDKGINNQESNVVDIHALDETVQTETEPTASSSTQKKRKRCNYKLRASEDDLREKWHVENNKKKDELLALKKEEYESKRKHREEIIELKKLKLQLKAKKYERTIENFQFNLESKQ